MLFMKRLAPRLLMCVVVLFTTRMVAEAQEPAPSAASILQQMTAAYAAVQSYSDNSFAKYRNSDGSERLDVAFRIWMARPHGFRVDAQNRRPDGTAGRREVMWTDGSAVRTWSTGKAVATRAKVQLAGSGMFGTYAYHVPTMIEPEYGASRRLADLSSPTVTGEEVFEGTDCYRVRGDWQGDTYEVWIGKSDHLVRKIFATYADHQLEEIHREIAINEPIALGTFRFAPEIEAASSTAPPRASPPATPTPSPSSKKSKR